MKNIGKIEVVGIESDCEYVEKEVDMAFYENYFAVGKDNFAVLANAGCQRISRCSCDCNRCSWG